jgi:hypothetical protein
VTPRASGQAHAAQQIATSAYHCPFTLVSVAHAA